MKLSTWQYADPHPQDPLWSHTCAAVPNGIVTVGGRSGSYSDKTDVHLFRNMRWSHVGRMRKVLRIFYRFKKL